MRVPIDHLIVVHEEVEIPDECPECGAQLSIDGDSSEIGDVRDNGQRLKVWEFQDQSRYARVIQFSDGEQEIDWDDGLPSSGESFRYCSWHCGECDHQLAVHNEHIIDRGDEEMIDGVLGL